MNVGEDAFKGNMISQYDIVVSARSWSGDDQAAEGISLFFIPEADSNLVIDSKTALDKADHPLAALCQVQSGKGERLSIQTEGNALIPVIGQVVDAQYTV